MERKDLDTNKIDLLTSAAKSVVGVVPIAGSLLSELVGNIIPNQRIDRLAKYIKQLDDKISLIPLEKIQPLLNKEEFIDLIEEGFVQASRAITDERREYIASIIANGISDENIKLEESKILMKILQELNDIEIIWLRSFLFPFVQGDEEFRKKHENLLKPLNNYLSMDDEAKTKYAIQQNYKEHLERLELTSHIYQIDRKTALPEFDKTTGHQKKSSTRITILGRLLLKQIGLTSELNPK